MKCQNCGKRATIEEVKLIKGAYRKLQLCEACAVEFGVLGTALPKPHPAAPVVTGAVVTIRTGTPASATRACSACGLTFEAFRESGKLGCPHCYAAFEDRLWPLISRAHEGATHHVGKIPRRLLETALAQCDPAQADNREAIDRLLGASRQREEKIQTLKQQLAAALRAERYEHAAMIRDEISRLLSARVGGARPHEEHEG